MKTTKKQDKPLGAKKDAGEDFKERLGRLTESRKKEKPVKRKLKKSVKLGLVGLVGVIVLVGYVLLTNYTVTGVESDRDTRLDSYEVTKIQVMRDLESYLLAKTEEEFVNSKRDVRFTSELKNDIYGSDFNYTYVQGYDSVSFLDVQYSLEYDGMFKVFLLTSLERDGETKLVSFVVSVRSGKAFDMIAF